MTDRLVVREEPDGLSNKHYTITYSEVRIELWDNGSTEIGNIRDAMIQCSMLDGLRAVRKRRELNIYEPAMGGYNARIFPYSNFLWVTIRDIKNNHLNPSRCPMPITTEAVARIIKDRRVGLRDIVERSELIDTVLLDSREIYGDIKQTISQRFPRIDSEETKKIVKAIKRKIHPDNNSPGTDYLAPNGTAIARAQNKARHDDQVNELLDWMRAGNKN